ncbi:MAG TPA: hypothetical protein VLD19_04950 [Chitinophagaceae bacterium]|nr:hypothetical protein [Chitinophagaceae bacterium]
MPKYFSFLFSLFMAQYSFGQNDYFSKTRVIDKDSIAPFVSRLKEKIVNDTIKFSRSELVKSSIGALNKQSYSDLFVINGKYRYKMDVIDSRKVLEFINEFLVADKISHMSLLAQDDSYAVYGELGKNRTILIEMRNKKKINFSAAGFRKSKYGGDNFAQR